MPDPFIEQSALVAQLRASLETIEWASSLVPAKWTHRMPDWAPPGAWPVAMNLAHLVTYEESIGLPVLADLAHGGEAVGVVTLEQSFLEDARVIADDSVASLLHRFRSLRQDEIAIVEAYEESELNSPVTDAFNEGTHGARRHSAAFVATKSFQHTWEHGNSILRVLLFAPD